MKNYKSFSYEVKDVDKPAGIVDIYVNAFGNKDSDGDISAEGSFNDTLTEDFKRIKHLHNHNKHILLGLPKEFPKDPFGLRVVSKMNSEKEVVKDVLSDYVFFKDNDRTLEHSIGYEVLERDTENTSLITKYKLFEYSTLSFLGANPNTPFLGLKSQESIIDQIELLVKMYNRTYSDGRLNLIEKQLIQLTNPAFDSDLEPLYKSLNSFQTELKALI